MWTRVRHPAGSWTWWGEAEMSNSISFTKKTAGLAVIVVLVCGTSDINAAEILSVGKDGGGRRTASVTQILEDSYNPRTVAAIIGGSASKSRTEKPRSTIRTARVVDPSGLRRVERFQHLIDRYAQASNLEPNLVKAVIYAESGGDPHAVSTQGASGLMQIMPATAAELGVVDLFDPADNIESGTRYLATLMERFHAPELALWAYNAGPGSVDRDIMPSETQKYVPKVMKIRRILDRQSAAKVEEGSAQMDGSGN